MGKLKFYIMIVAMLFIYKSGISQDSTSVLYLNIEIAAENNPKVKAAFNEYLAALEKVPQVGSLPDPQASFGYFIKPMELLGGNQTGNLQVMQMFPWFGTLKMAKDEASMMAKAKFEAFNSVKAELFFQVKSSWFQLMRYDKEIELVRNNLELLESIEKLALIRFQSPSSDLSSSEMQGSGSAGNMSDGSSASSGSGMNGMSNQQNKANVKNTSNTSSGMSYGMESKQTGLQEVLRVKMEILDQKNKLALLSDQRQSEQVRFNALLNRDLKTMVQISDSLIVQHLSINKLALADSILSNNSMLAMIKSEIDSYAIMQRKAKKMGAPMVGLGLNYMFIEQRAGNTSMMNGKDMIMPMISVTLPIYRKKYHAMQNEARLLEEAGNQQVIEEKNNLLVQYNELIQNIDDAERRIALYKEQQELAQKTTDLLVSAFSTTGNNYEEVLRMQIKVRDYGFNYIEAIVDYNTSLARAEMLMNSLNF